MLSYALWGTDAAGCISEKRDTFEYVGVLQDYAEFISHALANMIWKSRRGSQKHESFEVKAGKHSLNGQQLLGSGKAPSRRNCEPLELSLEWSSRRYRGYRDLSNPRDDVLEGLRGRTVPNFDEFNTSLLVEPFSDG